MSPNQNSTHNCTQLENITSLKKDVENIKSNVNTIETKQDKLEDYVLEIRGWTNEQKKTNEYMAKMLEQNQQFIDKLDSKYEKEFEEIKKQLHSQEIQIITENQKQDKDYTKDKTALILKVLGWIIGVIGVLGSIIWNFLIK